MIMIDSCGKVQYLEDTEVSVMITKPNAENAYYEKYLFLKY